MENVRKAVLNSLVKWDLSSSFSNIEINTTLKRANFSLEDSNLYTALFMGVCEKRLTLDYIISQYSNIPLDKIEIETLNILRMGIYQIMYFDKIPDYSAVNESVNLSSKRTKGFVNAVLRNFIRNDKKVNFPKEKWNEISYKNSIPMWIIDVWRSSYGDEKAEKLCTYLPKDNSISLRVNTLKTTTENILNILSERDIKASISSYTDDIVKCQAGISKIIDLIDTGCVFVQDEASRIATKVLQAKENDMVADVCACPGGKTFSLAIDMNNKGKLLSSDLHKNKLSLICSGAERLGINIIETKEQNAKEFVPEYEAAFDKVICDVPCSGLGVIYKKPDIKYKDSAFWEALPKVQYEILENVSRYVKIGGVLVYSTCTLNEKENSENIKKFLQKDNFVFDDFEIGNIKSVLGMHTFLPYESGTDGFFVAKMKRVK